MYKDTTKTKQKSQIKKKVIKLAKEVLKQITLTNFA